ncbi:MAG: hypothetical protein AB7U85_09155 [Alphaproteobacteria bacterium]
MHYINELSENQIRDFLIALSFIMNADGEASEAEKEYIKVAASAYGLVDPDFELIMKERSLGEVERQINWIREKPEAARYMIREMISLAISDGELVDDEINTIFYIGKRLGISEDRMNDMTNWAVEGYEWQIEGFRLVEENE